MTARGEGFSRWTVRLLAGVGSILVVLGAFGGRDWRPMHHDHKFAVERNGVRDIFLNTTGQAAFFERYITDWTGPEGRIRKVSLRLGVPNFPGDTMTMTGEVVAIEDGAAVVRVLGRNSTGPHVTATVTVGPRSPGDT